MVDQVYVVGGNGELMLHDLPLPPGLADRIAAGDVKIVNIEGDSDNADKSARNRRAIKEAVEA